MGFFKLFSYADFINKIFAPYVYRMCIKRLYRKYNKIIFI